MLQLARAILEVASDVLRLVVLFLRSSSAIRAENLVLRRQLARYIERGIKPKRVDHATRVSLALFSRLFNWRDAVVIVRPATIVRWHRLGWRIFWRWKCRAGRPVCSANIGVAHCTAGFPTTIRRSPAPLRASTRDASRPRSISQARAYPPPNDVGILTSGSRVPAEDLVHRGPGCCAVYRDCNVLPRISGLSADAPRTSGSANPDTPVGSCRSLVHKSRSLSGSAVVISVPSRPAP
jgi:hypothetical protein